MNDYGKIIGLPTHGGSSNLKGQTRRVKERSRKSMLKKIYKKCSLKFTKRLDGKAANK